MALPHQFVNRDRRRAELFKDQAKPGVVVDDQRRRGGECGRQRQFALISARRPRRWGALQQRAELFVGPGDVVYEGMIVGENGREEDMPVNPTKEKQLSNMRATGSDRNIILKPPRQLTLETALEYIDEDELVEVTPNSIRLRKMLLSENDRRKAARKKQPAGAA